MSENPSPETDRSRRCKTLLRRRADSSRLSESAAPGLPSESWAASLRSAGLRSDRSFQKCLDLIRRDRCEMELQAARADRLQQRIGRRREQNQSRGFGRLFENLEEEVGVRPTHRIGAVEDEDTAAALRLEIGSALDGAQLPDANHGPRHRSAQAYRIGNDHPNVRMRFEDQRSALDGRCIRAFAALGEACLESAALGRRAAPSAGRSRIRRRNRREGAGNWRPAQTSGRACIFRCRAGR